MIKLHDTYEYTTIFTQEDVEAFAKLTEDSNPIHLNPNFAKNSKFGRQIVQGILVSCAFSKVFGTMWPGDKDSFFISQEVIYNEPVFVEEPYKIKFECTGIDQGRNIGTIVGQIYDNSNNVIVKVTARIFSKEFTGANS